MTDEEIIQAFATVRAAIGAGAWIAPRLVGRTLGADPRTSPQAAYLSRLFGIRDLALGAGLSTSQPDQRTGWLRVGMGSDLGDAVASFLAVRRGEIPRLPGLMAGASGVAAGALGLYLLRRQSA